MPLLKSWFFIVNNPPQYLSTLPLPNEMEFWKLVTMTFTRCPKDFPFCFYSFLVLLTCLNSFCFNLTFHFSPPISVVLLIYSKIPTAHRINPMMLNIGLNHPGSSPSFQFSTLSSVYHSLVLLSKFSRLCPKLTVAYTSIFPQASLGPMACLHPHYTGSSDRAHSRQMLW